MNLLVGCCFLLSACDPRDVDQQDSDDARPMSTETSGDHTDRAVQWLGVETRSVSDRSTARQLSLPRVIRGALVKRVIQSMAAARAGLKRGDVITEIRVGRGGNEVGYSIGSSA